MEHPLFAQLVALAQEDPMIAELAQELGRRRLSGAWPAPAGGGGGAAAASGPQAPPSIESLVNVMSAAELSGPMSGLMASLLSSPAMAPLRDPRNMVAIGAKLRELKARRAPARSGFEGPQLMVRGVAGCTSAPRRAPCAVRTSANAAARRRRHPTSRQGDPEIGGVLRKLEAEGPAAIDFDDAATTRSISAAMAAALGVSHAPPLSEAFGPAFVPTPAAGAGGAGGATGASGAGDAGEASASDDGMSELHAAACDGDAEALKQLLAGGAEVDARDEAGRTAAHLAAGYGELEILSLLLAAGASVDARDGGGNTPLHFAASYGTTEAVQRLLAAGADRGAVNGEGQSARQIAVANGHDDAAAALC